MKKRPINRSKPNALDALGSSLIVTPCKQPSKPCPWLALHAVAAIVVLTLSGRAAL